MHVFPCVHSCSNLILPIFLLAALKRLRASNDVEDDVEEMRAEQRAHSQEARISMLQLLRSSSLRMPLVIAVIMQLSQQFSGINAVSAPSLFSFLGDIKSC